MAYKAPQIYDRVAVGDNKYRMQELGDGLIILIPAPDEVTEAGTNINRELLQPALNAIESHDVSIENMPNDITSAIVNNPRGWVTHTITKAHLNSSNEYAIPVNGSRYAIYLPDEFSITTN
ncbi:MAG: hypothetical protein HFE63_03445, partial [Clostridiales bacterium]|nr:hypothetical protein [Clostridiales bacterium]